MEPSRAKKEHGDYYDARTTKMKREERKGKRDEEGGARARRGAKREHGDYYDARGCLPSLFISLLFSLFPLLSSLVQRSCSRADDVDSTPMGVGLARLLLVMMSP